MTISNHNQNPSPPTTRKCTLCAQVLPLTDFPRKRASFAARCKACANAYAKEYYEKNSATRIAKAAVHKKKTTATRMAKIEQLARQESCSTCGDTYDEAAARQMQKDRLALVGSLPNSRTLGMLASRQGPQDEFDAIANHQQLVWHCRRCSASRPHERVAPVSETIVSSCADGDSVTDIFNKVIAAGVDTTLSSVRVTMGNLVSTGRLERISRGRYRATGL